MFKNSTIQMRIVKDDQTSESDRSSTSISDTMYIMHETGKGLVKGAIAIVAVYVALDTARQVTVNAAPKKH